MLPDEGTINLRKDESDDEAEFRIGKVDESKQRLVGNVEAASMTRAEEAALTPHTKVKVKFDKFVNLVATHAYEEIFDKHLDEDVIISTDLLTDLANAHEEKQDRKMPVIFLVGILLGVVLTWILLRT
ncbi:hypothetical protein GF366_01085 [Candidatus Peregrinibacteria bacterium]|nr:hypothetical protein [Candidatus Peregrinibacteria bacterium]